MEKGTGKTRERSRQVSKGRIISITNQKGGVGKTTTAISLSACIADMGYKCLLVDMDPQGNATSGVGIERSSIDGCVYNVLVDGAKTREIIMDGPIEGLSILPSTIDLAAAEIELAAELSREHRLKMGLEQLDGEYDYIIIDCPPALGLLTINSLSASQETLVPIQCEYYALEGLVFLMRTIQRVKLHVNQELKITGVLLTMFDARTNLSRDVEAEVRKEYPDITFKTVIPRSVRLSEAPGFGQPITIYEPSSKGAQAYIELSKEVVKIGEERFGERAGCSNRFSGVDGGATT